VSSCYILLLFILEYNAIKIKIKIKILLQHLDIFNIDHKTMIKNKHKVARRYLLSINLGKNIIYKLQVIKELIEIVIDDCAKQ